MAGCHLGFADLLVCYVVTEAPLQFAGVSNRESLSENGFEILTTIQNLRSQRFYTVWNLEQGRKVSYRI